MAERFVTRMAVYVILRNEQGQILLQQRSNTGYLDGYWDFAASGHVEHGETIQQTAVRELQEEAGVTVNISDLKLMHIDQYYVTQSYVNWVFVVDSWQGEPKITEPEKCSAMEWFAIDALPAKCVNTLRAVAKEGFTDELTYSITNHETYEALMGEPFDAVQIYTKK